MLKLKQNDRILLESLFKTDLGRAALACFKDVILREDAQPANAIDGLSYAVLIAEKQAELNVLKQLIKIGENNGGDKHK